MGTNRAAQLHAESTLGNCVTGHWGVDGLTAPIRYNLAGGYQVNGENVSGLSFCYRWGPNVRLLGSLKSDLESAMDGLMASAGHRRTILHPAYRLVNLGIAWDSNRNLSVVQLFEGDYIEFTELPRISKEGTLTLSGRTKNGATVSDRDLGISIYYDPPPHDLTRGQIARTYCLDPGLIVASLRRPPGAGYFYVENRYDIEYGRCPSPYDVPSDAPPPMSPDEARGMWRGALQESVGLDINVRGIPWITASEWRIWGQGTNFDVSARIHQIIREHGDGVYRIFVSGLVNGEKEFISEYSVFHGITPPDGYAPE